MTQTTNPPDTIPATRLTGMGLATGTASARGRDRAHRSRPPVT